MWRRRLSAVAQGPLTMRGRSGRHVNGCLRQEAAPPFPHRIGALAADMFSRGAVTDCRSSLTGKPLSVLCVGPSKNCLVWMAAASSWVLQATTPRTPTSGGVDPFSMVLRLVPVLQALQASRICRGGPRKRPQVPLDPAARRRRVVNEGGEPKVLDVAFCLTRSCATPICWRSSPRKSGVSDL